jgi:hypothetical protein
LGAVWIWRVTGGTVIVVKNVENVCQPPDNKFD